MPPLPLLVSIARSLQRDLDSCIARNRHLQQRNQETAIADIVPRRDEASVVLQRGLKCLQGMQEGGAVEDRVEIGTDIQLRIRSTGRVQAVIVDGRQSTSRETVWRRRC